MNTDSSSYNVVMFAHNEAANLQQSVSAVHRNTDDNLDTFYLLANGCTDATVAVARELKRALSFHAMQVIDIPFADKCNAWNSYVHDIASVEVPCHFFVDADVTFSDACFPAMAQQLLSVSPTPNVIAGVPLSGRNLAFHQMLVRERSCFFGNLYGLHSGYLRLIRDKSFRLPTGLNWIDSFLTKAANTDLTFTAENLPGRVTYLEGIGFSFESLSPLSWADIKLYKNRIARYELGKLQEKYLDKLPAEQWPADMSHINQDIDTHFRQLTSEIGLIKRFLVRQRLSRLLARPTSLGKS